jgi:hypothetical protein
MTTPALAPFPQTLAQVISKKHILIHATGIPASALANFPDDSTLSSYTDDYDHCSSTDGPPNSNSSHMPINCVRRPADLMGHSFRSSSRDRHCGSQQFTNASLIASAALTPVHSDHTIKKIDKITFQSTFSKRQRILFHARISTRTPR